MLITFIVSMLSGLLAEYIDIPQPVKYGISGVCGLFAVRLYMIIDTLLKTAQSDPIHFLQNLSEWTLPLEDDILEEALKLSREISKNKNEQDFACTCKGCNYCLYSYLCPQK